MKNIFFLIFPLFLFNLIVLGAEEVQEEKITALYLFSQEGDYIGRGRRDLYELDNENVIIKFKGTSLYIYSRSMHSLDNRPISFSLSIAAPTGQNLSTDVFMNTLRFADKDNPGFDFSFKGGGCNVCTGRFKILELEVNENNDVVSLAIDFFQRCEKMIAPPLFGAIRYNSNVPIKAIVSEIYGNRLTPESVFYYTNKNDDNEKEYMDITSRDLDFLYAVYKERAEGLIVQIFSKHCIDDPLLWEIEFTTFKDEGMVSGLQDLPSTPRSFDEGMLGSERLMIRAKEISLPYFNKFGEFKILDLKRNNRGQVEELALNLLLRDETGRAFEGALRYNSEIPIDLLQPFN